jgi:hypothetical protein
MVRDPLEQDSDSAAGGAAHSGAAVARGQPMKYADMQKQLDSGRFEKRPRNTTKPAYKPALSAGTVTDPGEKGGVSQPDLLTHLEAETWLAERLKEHNCDIYAGGPYATYADRLGAAIVRNGLACVVVGRTPERKPETYAQLFQRIAGKALPKAVDGSTINKMSIQHQTQKVTP